MSRRRAALDSSCLGIRCWMCGKEDPQSDALGNAIEIAVSEPVVEKSLSVWSSA
jgi:hypothetical protein